jgi:hypothetical protein
MVGTSGYRPGGVNAPVWRVTGGEGAAIWLLPPSFQLGADALGLQRGRLVDARIELHD